MELDRNKKESWIFAVKEALADFEYKAKYTSDPSIAKQWDEAEEALTYIEKALNPLLWMSNEKIALMQQKDLFQQLYIMTFSGSKPEPTPEERSQVADMILRRKDKPNV